MDQPTIPPAQSTPSNPPNQPVKKSLLPPNIKKFMIPLLIAVLLLLVGSVLLLSTGKQNKPIETTPEAKTWELILNYNTLNQTLSLKQLSLLDKDITQDFRSASTSTYEIVVLDKSERALFRTKVNITEQILFNILMESVSSQSANLTSLPEALETILYIPYKPSAAKIQITKNFTPILEINVTPEVSWDIIPDALAQTTPNSCGPMQIVFISDGYNNESQFYQDVEQLKGIFNSTQPFAAANPSIFDFKELYNTTSLGCLNGIIPDLSRVRYSGCIQNPQIQQIGRSKYPNASKFIVVVNNPTAFLVDGALLGATNDIGGDVAVFTNRQERAPKFAMAAHEFLGHAVGQLYDRYVSAISGYGILSGGIRSNCTDNRNGESFWRTAGSQGVYQGCSNQTYFASSPLSCPIRTNPFMVNGGSSTSLMSAYGCGGNSFDSVESSWITQNIIPKYQTACSVVPSPISHPSASPSAAPPTLNNPPIGTSGHFVQGYVFVDSNRNFAFEYTAGTYGGIYYAPEVGFNGATITLDNRSTTTAYAPNIDGFYLFNDVPTGSHTITLTVPAGYQITAPNSQVINPYTYTGTGSSYHPYNQAFTLLAPNKLSFVLSLDSLPVAGDPTRAAANIWFGIAPVSGSGTTSTSPAPQASSSPSSSATPTSSPSSSSSSGTIGVYVCEEVPSSNQQGSQVQINTLRCTLQ